MAQGTFEIYGRTLEIDPGALYFAGPVDNPVYPGLNPNLRVYVEWANEVWNWAFDHAAIGANAAADPAA